MYQNQKVGFILLSGGQGLRFGSTTPKQYLLLEGKPLALHSLKTFERCVEIDEFVVVCAEEFQSLFTQEASRSLQFAPPGQRRQDSVENGLKVLSEDIEIICIHDAARPFATSAMLTDVLEAASMYGASAVGMPVKSTLKECDENGIVIETLNRSKVWEVQTPQVLARELLEKGLEIAIEEEFTATDDTSLAELCGAAVKIVRGSYANIKITTPEDLAAYANV